MEEFTPDHGRTSWWRALLRTLAYLDQSPSERLAREVEAVERRLRSVEAQTEAQRKPK